MMNNRRRRGVAGLASVPMTADYCDADAFLTKHEARDHALQWLREQRTIQSDALATITRARAAARTAAIPTSDAPRRAFSRPFDGLVSSWCQPDHTSKTGTRQQLWARTRSHTLCTITTDNGPERAYGATYGDTRRYCLLSRQDDGTIAWQADALPRGASTPTADLPPIGGRTRVLVRKRGTRNQVKNTARDARRAAKRAERPAGLSFAAAWQAMRDGAESALVATGGTLTRVDGDHVTVTFADQPFATVRLVGVRQASKHYAAALAAWQAEHAAACAEQAAREQAAAAVRQREADERAGYVVAGTD